MTADEYKQLYFEKQQEKAERYYEKLAAKQAGTYNYEDYEDEEEDEDDWMQYRYYISNPETDENGVLAFCRALYQGSAQCNMHMDNFAQISRYMSQYELDTESRYCTFIDNIVYGSFDESGDIYLKSDSFSLSDWANPSQYKKLKMPASQAIYLSMSIIVCIAMAATAAYTQRTLTRGSSPWRPKRPVNMNAEDLARQHSGIGMARSRSGPSSTPLI